MFWMQNEKQFFVHFLCNTHQRYSIILYESQINVRIYKGFIHKNIPNVVVLCSNILLDKSKNTTYSRKTCWLYNKCIQNNSISFIHIMYHLIRIFFSYYYSSKCKIEIFNQNIIYKLVSTICVMHMHTYR